MREQNWAKLSLQEANKWFPSKGAAPHLASAVAIFSSKSSARQTWRMIVVSNIANERKPFIFPLTCVFISNCEGISIFLAPFHWLIKPRLRQSKKNFIAKVFYSLAVLHYFRLVKSAPKMLHTKKVIEKVG